MAKQTLYELLEAAEDASAEDIQRAFEDRRKAVSDAFEGEDRRNRLGFLDHAHHVLSDPRRRAAYDRDTRARAVAAQQTPAPQRSSGRLFAGLFIFAVGILLGRQFLPRQESPAPKVQTKAVAAKPAEKPTAADALPTVEEIAAALPPANGTADAGAAAQASSAPAAAPVAPPPVRIVVLGNPLMNKILDSTFAIVGSQAFGTGVAIEADRLLTNCHVIAPNVLKGKIYAISPVTGVRTEITEAAFLVKEDACVVHAPGLAGQPMTLGDTSQLQRGARFHNIGFAGGKLTLAEGYYLGSIVRSGQPYMVSTNFCAPGVSGGPLVDDDGRLVGLTSGGTPDRRYCASLTAETARTVLAERMMQINAFPPNYLTNFNRRW
jgi:hypothetical protein